MQHESDDDLRRRLVRVAAETFAEFGWRDSTVVELCARAEVEAGHFYRLYEGVDDFFVAMYAARTNQLVASTSAALKRVASSAQGGSLMSPRDATSAVARVFASTAADRTWWILSTEYMIRAVRHPDVAASYLTLRRGMRRELAGAAREALENAGLGGLVDADMLVRVATAIHRGAMAENFLEPGLTTIEDLDRVAWPAMVDALLRVSQSSDDDGLRRRAQLRRGRS